MKWNPLFNDDSCPTILLWKVSLSEKWVLNHASLEFPFIRGSPSHEWNETHPLTMTGYQLHYTTVKIFVFWKVCANLYNLRVPVYKGFTLPWKKWNPSLNDDCWPTILVWKDSLSEKWVLKYATLGFSFIRGLPSHEWNDTLPLTTTAGQLY